VPDAGFQLKSKLGGTAQTDHCCQDLDSSFLNPSCLRQKNNCQIDDGRSEG